MMDTAHSGARATSTANNNQEPAGDDVPTLVIDTSFGATVGVVGHEPHYEPDSRSHVEKLQPAIDSMVAEAGLVPADIRRVVVGTGPAPFTGLRAGIVAARAIGLATGAQVLGQDILEPQAVWVDSMTNPDGRRHLTLAVNDARRKQLYYALYEKRPDSPIPHRILDMDIAYAGHIAHRINEWLRGRDTPEGGEIVIDICGKGALRYIDAFQGIVALGQVLDDSALHGAGAEGPAIMERLALAHLKAGDGCPTEPLYLRRPDVSQPAPLKHVMTAEDLQKEAEKRGTAPADTSASPRVPDGNPKEASDGETKGDVR